jgi:chromosomal replication initiator protein
MNQPENIVELPESPRDEMAFLRQKVTALAKRVLELEKHIAQPQFPKLKNKTRRIIEIVAAHFHISPAEMFTETRRQEVCWPRQVAMAMAVKFSLKVHDQIALEFEMSRDAVRHSRRVVRNRKQFEPETRQEIESLEKQIQMELFKLDQTI